MRVGLFHRPQHNRPELAGGARTNRDDLLAERGRRQGVRPALVADQLDDANFPPESYPPKAAVASGSRVIHGFGWQRFNRLETIAVKAQTWGRHTLNRGTRCAGSAHGQSVRWANTRSAAFSHCPATRWGEVIGNH